MGVLGKPFLTSNHKDLGDFTVTGQIRQKYRFLAI